MLLALIASSLVLAAQPAKKGDSWESLAKANYGSAHYGPLLAVFNASGGKKLTAGTQVDLPAMESGITALKMEGAFEGLVRQIASAGTSLSGLDAELQRARPKKATDKVQLPTPVMVRLQKIISDVDIARSGAASLEMKYDPPKKAIDDLAAASAQLDAMRLGKLDAKGDDVQQVHQHLAAAMLEIIRWYRAGFR